MVMSPNLSRWSRAVPDQRSERRQGDPAGDEHQVLAVEILNRERVAVGSPHADAVAHLKAAERLGHPADRAEAALDMTCSGRRRGDAEGRLAGTEGRIFGELAGAEGEVLPDFSS